MTTRIQFVYDTSAALPSRITTFYHCARCLEEWNRGLDDKGQPIGPIAPRDYARTQSGITDTGAIQVWCVRHDVNIAHISPRLKRSRPHQRAS